MPLPALVESRQEPRRENVAQYATARELGAPGLSTSRKAVERHYFASAVPTLLKERELSFLYSPAAAILPDKVFALTWLGEHHLLLGTKCNRLLRVAAAEAPSRSGASSATASFDKPVVEIALPARPPPSRAAAARRAAVAAAAALFGFAPTAGDRPQRESGGIHALEVSPNGAWIATGGTNPCDMALLHGDTLSRAALCMGHSDWLFSVCWLSDDLVASGARDGRVLLWSARAAARADAAAPGAASPLASRARHAGGARVRALALAPGPSRLASLSNDGSLRLYDTAGGLSITAAVPLPHTSDLVCVAGAGGERNAATAPHAHLLAVGSVAHITLVDGRARKPLASMPSEDGGAGVRSLSLRGHVLTIGGAAGKLSFLDLRTHRYLTGLPAQGAGASRAAPQRRPPVDAGRRSGCAEPLSPRAISSRTHLCTGRGRYYEAPDAAVDPAGAALAAQAYAISLSEYGQSQAVYAHAWDAAGARLAAAGGPLMMSARGCYAAVWEH